MSLGPLVDPVARAVATALDGVAMRQRVVADNLANASTPGYRAKEVSFEDALARALGTGQAPETVSATVDLADSPVKADGNSVDVTEQSMKLGETELAYQSLVNAFNFRHNVIRDALAR